MALDVYKDWLGIADGPRPPGHYELLRLVQFEDDEEKIRNYYRKLNAHVRKYASGQYSVQSQDLLNELAKAMLCLTDPLRKREYDESLGRVFEEDKDSFGRKPLENILVDQGHISRDQLKEVQKFADARGLSMRDAVVQMKLVEPPVAAQALAMQLGLSYVDLAELIPDDSVLDRVPRNVVKRHSILPLFIDNDTVIVACIDEPTPQLEEELRLRFGMPMRAVIATPLAINQGIAKYYAAGMRNEAAADAAAGNGAKAGKKSKGGDSAKKPKAAASEPRLVFSQLSPEEQQQRKQLGWIIMCWGTLGGVAIDYFILRGFLVRMPIPFSFGYLATFIAGPAAIFWVLKSYWK
ncbi:MAG: hypothetical protein AB7O26_09335 [Planctomycetaceae bacterium]